MGSLLSRSVQIEISNNTWNISLRRPRTFLECGRCLAPPLPELSPGSKDRCTFPGAFPFWGVAGILVYESESFTLAVYFSNPIDYNKFSMELGLELSMEKVHLNPLESTYERMARGSYSSSEVEIQFHRVTVGKGHGSASVSAGPVKVTATMSRATDSVLRVVLEGQDGWLERSGSGRHYQENSEVEIQFHRVTVGKGHGSASVSAGPVKVTATMSRATDSVLRVVLEGQDGWLERSGSGRHYQEK